MFYRSVFLNYQKAQVSYHSKWISDWHFKFWLNVFSTISSKVQLLRSCQRCRTSRPWRRSLSKAKKCIDKLVNGQNFILINLINLASDILMCTQNLTNQFSLVSAKNNTQQIVVLLYRTSYQTDFRATYAHICKLFLRCLCSLAKWFLSLRPNSGAPPKIPVRPPGLLIVEVSASSTIEQGSSMIRFSKNNPMTSWDCHFHSYLKMGRWSTQPKLVKNQCLGQFTTLNLNIQWG